jgi:hypothetical protein
VPVFEIKIGKNLWETNKMFIQNKVFFIKHETTRSCGIIGLPLLGKIFLFFFMRG